MAYYITGDCHGDFGKIIWFNSFNNKLAEDDVMILLGDVALNFYGNEKDVKNKRILDDFPNEFLCIHGNHEARPAGIEEYREKEWRGGIVYYEPEYPRILFAKDGEIYDFDEEKAIAIGGAYSIDKEYRLTARMPWFPDEQPSDEIKKYVESQLRDANWKVDYVLSHTCPLIYEPADLFLNYVNQSSVDKSTEMWLSDVASKLTYKRWYFGHYHENREFGNATMLFEEIQELGKKGFLQRIGRPKYKNGEMVLFYVEEGNVKHECYGRIRVVDTLGTFGQAREVSYDIEGPDYRNPSEVMLYKHFEESKLQSLNELSRKSWR